MITPHAIAYTWRRVFERLGVQAEGDYFRYGNHRVYFHYAQPAAIKKDPRHFHLVVPPGNPKDLALICDDARFPVARLRKGEFLPPERADFPADTLPVLFWGYSAAKDGFARIISDNSLLLQPDLIESIFFLLSRYEERHLGLADAHGRFPYSASAACRHDFIELPLVDLYVLALRRWLEKLTGAQAPPAENFEVRLSHDVDFIALYRPFSRWLRQAAKDSLHLKPGDLKEDLLNIKSDPLKDPYLTGVRALAETSSRHGFRSVFNLMAAEPSRQDDGYALNSEAFKAVVRAIANNGHQIGLHASYRSYDQPELLAREKLHLEAAIGQEVRVVRQHYLRARAPRSWQAWQNAGFTRDTTYGYAEHEGFRCGTCHPYRVFDLENDREMELVEEPLIVMDTTLRTYRQMNVESAIQKIFELARLCRAVRGKFTLLWHNTSFTRNWKGWGIRYPELIAGLAAIARGG